MRKRGRSIDAEFQIVRCRRCKHVYVDPRVADEHLVDLYDEAYYAGNGFDETIAYDAAPSARRIAEFRDVAEMARNAFSGPLAGKTWLDYGCGSGQLLALLVAEGIDAYGFDSSPAARRACRIDAYRLIDDEAQLASRTFDVVSAFEVIEHVPDPRAFLARLTSLLKPGGILLVASGNFNMVRHIPKTPYIMPEGHIHYFTPATMRRLFDELPLRERRDVLNRQWFLWREAPIVVRSLVRPTAMLAASRLVARLAPAVSAFPIAQKVACKE